MVNSWERIGRSRQTKMEPNQMSTITYGNYSVDTTTLPEASVSALLSRGLTHFLGNEQASKLASWVKGEGQANSDDKATCTAWKEANAQAVSDKMAELVKSGIAALTEGTIGTRASAGPRVSPLDTMVRSIAKKEVLGILATHSIKAPKKDEKVRFANGTEKSLDEMIATRIEKEGERITKEAEKAIREATKKAETIKAQAGAVETVDADALGI